jgi:hypothetical protein
MLKWLHHLFNPHCPDCKADNEDLKVCLSCETLKAELASERFEKNKLLSTLLEVVHPVVRVEKEEQKELQPIAPRTVPWNVKRQMLEAEDRVQAKIIADKQREEAEAAGQMKIVGKMTTEELERALGVNDAS